ncbi:unnamed protein product [Rotaria magnacalcarata]|uniref:Uncharacterized protein n=1 Tax=Rotaria magnacalcarata TaxID=392030 RepID=A0A816SQ44_9BILA|nr:unnamed protein product [Rotaria magnacalcarata]CAF2086562.1 unnamed protein product [Rotaria magnacalcarata]
MKCPICRYPLNGQHEYSVSYNLEEACRLYQMANNSIDYSTIRSHPANIRINLTPTTSSSEIYVRGSQSDLNDIVQNEATSTRPSIILSFIFASLLTLKKNERKSRQLKKCGHYCFLTLTPQCCSCSDQRPYSENNHYDAYIDGHGIKNLAQRNRHYCPGCKKE